MRFEVVAFDVNETLLDVSALSGPFAETVGSAITIGEWFARLLHRSLLSNQLGEYRPFGTIAKETLLWLATRAGVDLEEEAAEELISQLTVLPPHPDVRAGLGALGGTRLVTLTNGSQAAADLQLANAGLDGHFEAVLSVEAVGRFKPDPEVYRYAARACGVNIEEMLLVAAHDWDVAGAQAAGASGCFVRRLPWGLPEVVPDLEIDDIGGLPAVLED